MADNGDPATTEPRVVASDTVPSTVTGTQRPTFDDVYRLELTAMVRLATLLTGSSTAAEDLVAESFATLLVRWRSVDRPGAYLRRCVVNACIGRRRRSWREAPSAAAPDTRHADDDLGRIDLANTLADALATLPARQRAAIVLRFYSGLSELETAETLGCRPGTVGSLVHRGLAGLRIELEEES